MSNKKVLQRIRFWSLVFFWVFLIQVIILLPIMVISYFGDIERASDFYLNGITSYPKWQAIGYLAAQFIGNLIRMIPVILIFLSLSFIIQFVLALMERLEKRSGLPADADIPLLPEPNG